MPIDRNATLKTAEKLLRQGKLQGAIEEYVRLVEDQPRDWNSMNALGDLYVRAGDVARAVAQFTHIADHFHHEGFFPKAAALYKKALKVQGDHEHSLMRLGEIAVGQGLVADAKLYLGHLADVRRGRGDERGANECVVALGAFGAADLKLSAARAARGLDDTPRAAALFREAADAFGNDGRRDAALDALVEATELSPEDATLRAEVVSGCMAAGDLERAARYLTRDSAGDDPDLLLALGRIDLAREREQDARAAFSRLLVVAPERWRDVLRVADEQTGPGRADAAYGCVEVVAEAAILAGDLDGALAVLQSFLRHGGHVPALMKLVEVAIDAGRDDVMRGAQEGLVDAFVDAGRGDEARLIAEDLVAHDPSREDNLARLRRALVLVGAPDPDALIARHLESRDSPGESLDLDEGSTGSELSADGPDAPSDLVPFEPDSPAWEAPAPAPQEAARADAPGAAPIEVTAEDDAAGLVVEAIEIDLSEAVLELGSMSPAPMPLTPRAGEPAAPAQDLEHVFAQMRARVQEDQSTAPAARLERGLEHLEHGRTAEAIADLRAAVGTPMLRFTAAARLGRIYSAGGEPEIAVEWLERAAEAPAPSAEEGRAVLYELADALERMGEEARALAVLIEIDADQSGYRDVPARIEHLTRTRARSHDE